MPFGTLKTKQLRHGVPLCSAPYQTEVENEFTDVDGLFIQYYTAYEAVKDLVPEEFELDDEPLISLRIYRYGFSPFGAYNELVVGVRVKWKGEVYNHPIQLILDNEAAIFAGRERWGIPKVFGRVVFDDPAVAPGFVTAYAERPIGSKLVQLSFKPVKRSQPQETLNTSVGSINIRSIPAPNCKDPPSLRDVVILRMAINKAEMWTGEGSVGLFNVSEFDPVHKLKVVRYESAFMVRHAEAVLLDTTPTAL